MSSMGGKPSWYQRGTGAAHQQGSHPDRETASRLTPVSKGWPCHRMSYGYQKEWSNWSLFFVARELCTHVAYIVVNVLK